MATQLFLRNTTEFSDFASPGTISDRGMITTRGASVGSPGTTLTAAATQIQMTSAAGGNSVYYWSPMLQAFTLFGTVTFNIWGLESVATANAGLAGRVEVCDQLGTVISTPVPVTAKGTELGTASAVQNWTATPTSTNVLNGQRLRLTVFFVNVGTMAAGTGTINFGAASAGVSGDSYLQLTETVVNFTGGLHPTWTPRNPYNASAIIRSSQW